MDTTDDAGGPQDLLQMLPYEILTDILMLVGSPKWLLAVARTSRYNCSTLLDEKSLGIWQTNREAAKLPKPLPIMTEWSYAAFVYDGGPCEACKQPTPNMYTSFAIKLRLCNRTECNTEMRGHIHATSGDPTDNLLMSWTPSMENCSWMGDHTNVNYWPNFRARLRMVDYKAATHAYEQECIRLGEVLLAGRVTPQTLQTARVRHAKDITRTTAVMKFSVELCKWKKEHEATGLAVKASNHQFSKLLSIREGFAYWDLCATETYKALLRHKNIVHERLTHVDTNVALLPVTAELARMRSRREARAREHQLNENRETLEKHYHGLCSREVMPTWGTFCSFSVVRELLRMTPVGQGAGTASTATKGSTAKGIATKEFNLAKALRAQPMRGLLEAQLEMWRVATRKALCAKAGVSDSVPVSSLRVHPVEQVNVRFACGRCKGVQRKYEYDESLDFVGVCAHECTQQQGGGKRKRDAEEWSVDGFVYDEQASNAMTRLVHAAGLDPSRNDCATLLKMVESDLLCKSCTPPLVLHYSSVLGHSKRHDDMQVERVTPAEARALRLKPIVPGLTRVLLHLHKPQGRLRNLSDAKVFSCRHCANDPTGAMAGPPNPEDNKSVVCDKGCGQAFPSKKLLKRHQTLHKNRPCGDTTMGDAANANATAPTAPAAETSDGAGRAGDKESQPEEKGAVAPIRMFNFNGMRSHLKERHNIFSIRDEDYDCHRDAAELKSMLQAVKDECQKKKGVGRSCVAS